MLAEAPRLETGICDDAGMNVVGTLGEGKLVVLSSRVSR